MQANFLISLNEAASSYRLVMLISISRVIACKMDDRVAKDDSNVREVSTCVVAFDGLTSGLILFVGFAAVDVWVQSHHIHCRLDTCHASDRLL